MDTVLIIGITGMLGTHIATHLQSSHPSTKIHGCSRSPPSHPLAGITYHQLDISSPSSVNSLLTEIKPTVIFHAASPTAADPNAPRASYLSTNVTGTSTLLSAATSLPECRAFVFTSSVSAYAGHSHNNIPETAPLWDTTPGHLPRGVSAYNETKALADVLVRGANGRDLKTVALRPSLVLGEGDRSFVPAMLGQPNNVQIGDGRNRMCVVAAGECARAHVLAAEKLLREYEAGGDGEGGGVGGEAFNIRGGDAPRFFDLCRELWGMEGRPISEEKVWKLNPAFMLGMAKVVEGVFWLVTLGQRKPEVINTMVVLHATSEHTYDGAKARDVLGFESIGEGAAKKALRDSVAWEMGRRKGEKN